MFFEKFSRCTPFKIFSAKIKPGKNVSKSSIYSSNRKTRPEMPPASPEHDSDYLPVACAALACVAGAFVVTVMSFFAAMGATSGFSILPFIKAGGQQFVIKIAASKPRAPKSRARNLERVKLNMGIFSE
jgi:hypothetical protein